MGQGRGRIGQGQRIESSHYSKNDYKKIPELHISTIEEEELPKEEFEEGIMINRI